MAILQYNNVKILLLILMCIISNININNVYV